MQSAADLLRQRGLRVTPQRLAVLQRMLECPHAHFTPDEIRAALAPAMPALARGTCYNVLNEFVRVRLAQELASPDGPARYGLALDPHHHVVCRVCGRIDDVDVRGVEGLRPEGLAPGFQVDGVDVVFRGLCPRCRKEAR